MHRLQLSLLMAFELSLPPIDHYGYSGAAFLETTSYHDAFVHPEWRHAIVEEIVALVRIDTWDVISLPPRARPIACKCVYNVNTLMVLLSVIRLQ